eukprot:scaffold22608_cov37-Cyclotella_meneghiniana.AAC.1
MVMYGWWRLLVAPLYLGYSLLSALPALLMGFREFVFKLATECFQLPRSRPPPDPDSTVQLRFGFLWSCLPFMLFLWRQTIFPSLFSYVLLQWMTMISFNIVHGNFGFWCAWVMQLPILALLVGIWLKPVVCWTEVLLSILLVQRRSSPVASVLCLYGGRWYLPHRRRRRRGESSIRMPRIYTVPPPPSCCTLFLLVLLFLVCFIGSVLGRIGAAAIRSERGFVDGAGAGRAEEATVEGIRRVGVKGGARRDVVGRRKGFLVRRDNIQAIGNRRLTFTAKEIRGETTNARTKGRQSTMNGRSTEGRRRTRRTIARGTRRRMMEHD